MRGVLHAPGCHPGGWKGAHLGKSPLLLGFPGGSDGKEPAQNAGDPGSIPGLGRWMEEPGELQFMGMQRVGHE